MKTFDFVSTLVAATVSCTEALPLLGVAPRRVYKIPQAKQPGIPAPWYAKRTPPRKKPDESSVLERAFSSGFPKFQGGVLMEDNNLSRQALQGPLYQIVIDGLRHVAAGTLAAQSGYCRDYIARLARQRRIAGRKVGRHWFIEEKSFSMAPR